MVTILSFYIAPVGSYGPAKPYKLLPTNAMSKYQIRHCFSFQWKSTDIALGGKNFSLFGWSITPDSSIVKTKKCHRHPFRCREMGDNRAQVEK